MTEKDELLIIIKNAKLGNEAAYNKLLNSFWNDIYRFQFSKTNDENEAEDNTIKTFARAFDKIDLFDEAYSFKNWVLTISRNIFIDNYRSQQKEIESIKDLRDAYEISDNEPSPEDQLIQEQNLSELLYCIKQLKPAQQKIIQLRYFQELSYKEISAVLEETMSSVKVKLLRSKKMLSEIIAQRNDQNN